MKYMLPTSALLLCALLFAHSNQLCATAHKDTHEHQEEEENIPATEDLMKEHGILNRVLLAYEEIIRRITKHEDFNINSLAHAVDIIETFIEDYHEKIEENYIFPLFEKNNREVKLVKTLRLQHTRGREITAKIKEIIASPTFQTPKQQKALKSLLKKFIAMYRPHESREDTVLFPQVRELISEEEFEELSDVLEDSEHELFGPEGFGGILNKVIVIEKELDIYELDQFTPEL